MMASQKGYKGLLELLIDKGANIDHRDNNDWTALKLALQNKHIETVKILINAGADTNDKEDGWPLILAV